ncbi:MAG: hypothetical protein PHY64_00190 [Eubacteriales bacterium]|nr:hypothetical protein [Eubacteriales bacterium]
MKNIIIITTGKETASVLFSDETTRSYKVQYTKAGRRFIKVYGEVIYDFDGKAI